jgi:hypothetical protein
VVVVFGADRSACTREIGMAHGRLAASHGARAVVCYPLDIDANVCGALNLYPATTAPLSAPAHLTTLLIAEQAGLLLGTVLARSRDQALIERLRTGADRDRSDTGPGGRHPDGATRM